MDAFPNNPGLFSIRTIEKDNDILPTCYTFLLQLLYSFILLIYLNVFYCPKTLCSCKSVSHKCLPYISVRVPSTTHDLRETEMEMIVPVTIS